VVPAGTDDGAAVERLVEANPLGSRLELLIVDRGVKAGAQRRLVASRGVRVDRVGWDEPQLDDNGRRVFRPIPYAWRVEVAHALVGRHRRLAKSFENTVSSATAWVQVSCAALLLRHLAE
jgi:putative transposase